MLHGVIGHVREIEEVPSVLVGRLMHYFSTYKLRPESSGSVTVNEPYGRAYGPKPSSRPHSRITNTSFRDRTLSNTTMKDRVKGMRDL